MASSDQDVDLALTGDATAFERLYARHAAGVYTLAARMFDAAEADSVTQDVFVRAWQKLATFRGEASFATWLRRIALNVFANRHRGLARERRADRDPSRLSTTAATSAATSARTSAPAAGLRMDLERAIGQLPPRARAVFVLHDVEGHSHDDIAELLQIRTGTSKSQLHRARQLLCSALREKP